MSLSHSSKLHPTKREEYETMPYMEFLDTKDASFVVDDALLDFTLEGEEDDQLSHKTISGSYSSSSTVESSNPAAATAPFCDETGSGSFPDIVEEELEWLSNKEAFPAVETCFGILSDNPELISNHKSPISVLENSTSSTNSNENSKGNTILTCFSTLKVPINFRVGARSKRRRRTSTAGPGESPRQHCPWPSRVNIMKNKRESTVVKSSGANIGRRCLHCQADKTPQWRAGPKGPKTLCNACGVRYKSGRLLPEYRPANSPTFSSTLHSNSHRKVVEMRKQKLGTEG